MADSSRHQLRTIYFLGLSGVGKSTLMNELCQQHPHLFYCPRRLTTRSPKKGDLPGELEYITRDEFLRLEEEGSLSLVMVQDTTIPREQWSYSGYRSAVSYEEPRVALCFASCFSLESILSSHEASNVLTCHIRADWQVGLNIRGGDTKAARVKLNDRIQGFFSEDALDVRVDVVFHNDIRPQSGVKNLARSASKGDAGARLYTALLQRISERFRWEWPAQALPGQQMKPLIPLSDFLPFHITANVRWSLSVEDIEVDIRTDGSAIGQEGDLVIGEVVVGGENQKISKPLAVFDQNRRLHHVSPPAALRVIAILGNRESSTHCNAGIPTEGLRPGGTCHWVARESGIVGQLFFDSLPNPITAAETAIGFRLIGILQRRGHYLLNEAHLSPPESLSARLPPPPAATTKTPAVERNLNIEHLAAAASASCPVTKLTIPVLCVAGTAAEVGKTTLTKRVIGALRTAGKRVAAIKTVGTGGVKDTADHIEAGAEICLDQVDAGLITTYCSVEQFRSRILRSFYAAESAGVDVIVAEVGGDICWANAPAFLGMNEVVRNLAAVLLMTNNALDALGACRFLAEKCPSVPLSRVCIFSSPFRNVLGMQRRAEALGLGAEGGIGTALADDGKNDEASTMYDPNDVTKIATLVTRAVELATPKAHTQERTDAAHASVDDINARDGQPELLHEFWCKQSALALQVSISPSEGCRYHEREIWHTDDLQPRAKGGIREGSSDDGADPYRAKSLLVQDLPRRILAVHEAVGNNVATNGRYLLIGAGARQLMMAAVHAVRKVAGRRLRITADPPYYAFYSRIPQVDPSVGDWFGTFPSAQYKIALTQEAPPDPSVDDGDAPELQIISLPSNPTGEEPVRRSTADFAVHDLSYYWPHYHPICISMAKQTTDSCRNFKHLERRDDDVMIFSLSKLTGHAGSRIGWALVKDSDIAAAMSEYIHHCAIRTSYESQLRAAVILGSLCENRAFRLGEMIAHCASTMRRRWTVLLRRFILPLQNLTHTSDGIRWCAQSVPYWCYLLLKRVRTANDKTMPFSSQNDEEEDAATMLYRLARVKAYPGGNMGGGPDVARISLGLNDASFGRLVDSLVAGLLKAPLSRKEGGPVALREKLERDGFCVFPLFESESETSLVLESMTQARRCTLEQRELSLPGSRMKLTNSWEGSMRNRGTTHIFLESPEVARLVGTLRERLARKLNGLIFDEGEDKLLCFEYGEGDVNVTHQDRHLPGGGKYTQYTCVILLSVPAEDFSGGRFYWNEHFDGETDDGKRVAGEDVKRRRFPDEESGGGFSKAGDCVVFHNKRGVHGVEEVLKGSKGRASRKTASLRAVSDLLASSEEDARW